MGYTVGKQIRVQNWHVTRDHQRATIFTSIVYGSIASLTSHSHHDLIKSSQAIPMQPQRIPRLPKSHGRPHQHGRRPRLEGSQQMADHQGSREEERRTVSVKVRGDGHPKPPRDLNLSKEKRWGVAVPVPRLPSHSGRSTLKAFRLWLFFFFPRKKLACQDSNPTFSLSSITHC